MHQYLVEFTKLDWNPQIPGLRENSFERDGKRLRLVEYTPEMTPHWCSKGHYGMVLEGEIELEFSDAVHIFRSGDGVFIPEGEEHRHRGKILTEIVRVIFVEDL